MSQETIQNTSYLYPEDAYCSIATWTSSITTSTMLSTATTWYRVGALAELSVEAANASVQPASMNVEHSQVVTKEAETINITIQEQNPTILNILRGASAQSVSTTLDVLSSTSTAVCTILYSGDNNTLTPMMIWITSRYSDGRSKSSIYPYVHYVSGGGSGNPKAQGTGEYQDIKFTLEARESTCFLFNNRKQFRIEVWSTAST